MQTPGTEPQASSFPAAQRGGAARLAAVRALTQVIAAGHMLDPALEPLLQEIHDARDRALAMDLCYGVLRWYYRLEAWLRTLLQRPLRPRDADIRVLLLVGLYELEFLRTPDHAAVSVAVTCARLLEKHWAASLVNGVLRQFVRNRDGIRKSVADDDCARFAHPRWMIDQFRADWPYHWQEILLHDNLRPPMDIRVNARVLDRDRYLDMLTSAGITAAASPLAECGIRLDKPVAVDRLPLFAEGAVSVQDLGAQLAAGLLDAGPGQRVLDACAAPGGKLTHILERLSGPAAVTAIENDPGRVQKIHDNLRRLKLSAEVIVADAARPDAWQKGLSFHRILLDAPCSATGVIRRHPDIKVLRKPEHLPRHSRTQSLLLEGLWPLLAPGGRLLYCTCSIIRLENDARIEIFLLNHKDARNVRINVSWGTATDFGRQALPALDGTDGFYYALLEKRG